MNFLDPIGLVGGISKGLSSFLHPEKGYESAEDALRKYFEESKGYQLPFMQHGLEQYPGLNDATRTLLNPAELQNKWAESYETSPYAKQLLNQNRESGLEAASSMGLMGSSGALGNIQQGAGNIVAQDRQNFLNDLMQKYMAGIGLGSNLYGVGAQTGANLGTQTGNFGQNMAGLEYGRTNAPGDMFGGLLRGGANIAANYFMPGAGNIWGAGNKFNPGGNV